MIYDLAWCAAVILNSEDALRKERINKRKRAAWCAPHNVAKRLAARDGRLVKRRALWREKYAKNSKETQRKIYQRNKANVIAKATEWRKENRERYNAHRRGRYHSDPQFKIAVRLRGRLNQLVGPRKHRASISLKIDRATLMAHLESLFKPGMNWANHGTVWHIDHVYPCSKFDLTKLAERNKCFSIKNLQPLWSRDNLSKGNKIPESFLVSPSFV